MSKTRIATGRKGNPIHPVEKFKFRKIMFLINKRNMFTISQKKSTGYVCFTQAFKIAKLF